MSWSTILFDLDGTLTDPKEGITKSVAHALRHFGIQVDDLDVLEKFIGPPLSESFPEYYGLDEEQTETAIAKYRERFSRVGWLENVPYPGIRELLCDLQRAGKALLVATSKPKEFAEKILEHFGLASYFTWICGAPMHAPKGYSKADVIREALRCAEAAERSDAIMVGDRHHDIDGAHEVGLPAVGVLYGYGGRSEHEAAGAEFIAEDMAQLRALLL